MGSTKYSDEQTADGKTRKVKVSGFRIAKTPTTNKQYLEYLRAAGQEPKEKEKKDPKKANHPVVKVSWFDAVKYCNWLSRNMNCEEVYEIRDADTVIWREDEEGNRVKGVRLLTVKEWEFAAKGKESRKYPWGNKWDISKVAFGTRGTEPVNAHPEGATPDGVCDLAGNVWEWCWDNIDDSSIGKGKVMCGGAWNGDSPSDFCNASRNFLPPQNGSDSVGFRVVKDLIL